MLSKSILNPKYPHNHVQTWSYGYLKEASGSHAERRIFIHLPRQHADWCNYILPAQISPAVSAGFKIILNFLS